MSLRVFLILAYSACRIHEVGDLKSPLVLSVPADYTKISNSDQRLVRMSRKTLFHLDGLILAFIHFHFLLLDVDFPCKGVGGWTYKFKSYIENGRFWKGRLRYKFKSYIEKISSAL